MTHTRTTSISSSWRRLLLTGLFVALAAAACGGGSSADAPDTTAVPTTVAVTTTTEATPPPPPSQPEQIGAILPPGTHVGISWFAPPAPGMEERAFALWEEANADATIGRVLVDWIDVEPSEGQYEFDDLEEQLRDITDRGALPMVTIAAVDVSGTPFPEWLGGFEPERAAAAYSRMLEAVAPLFDVHDVWLLAVANEPPLDEGLDGPDFTDFVAGVETRADEIMPDIPITFVFAGGDALKRDQATQELAAAVDVFSANHYCLYSDLSTIDLADIRSYLDESVELAGDKPVVLQEFGCPASELLGSSEEFQSTWFELAFDEIRADDQIVAAFVFEFGNWSPELVEADYGDALATEPGFGEFYPRLAEWLQTSGIIRPDGSTRPAWDVYLANLGG